MSLSISLILILAPPEVAPLATPDHGNSSDQTCATPLPPPPGLSPQAQAYLAGGDHRLLKTVPATVAEWQAMQERSIAQGELWLTDEIATENITVTRGTLGGVPVARVDPADAATDAPLVFNLHGGGFALNGGDASLYTAVAFAEMAGLPSVSVDYRLTPQHAYPAALDDAIAAYEALLQSGEKRDVVVYGLSAGGGLAASFLLKLAERGLPMPAAAVLNSPWSDMRMEGDSYRLNECHDPLIGRSRATLDALASMYVGQASLDDPYVSPVLGDWRDLDVPIMLISGTRDLLLSDTVRLHAKMRGAGLYAELIIYDGLWHAFSVAPEFRHMIAQVDQFYRRQALRGGRGGGDARP